MKVCRLIGILILLTSSVVVGQIDYSYFIERNSLTEKIACVKEYRYQDLRTNDSSVTLLKQLYLKSSFNKEGYLIERLTFNKTSNPFQKKMYTYSNGRLDSVKVLNLKTKKLEKCLFYLYDENSRKVSIINAENNKVLRNYSFNTLSQLSKIIDFDNRKIKEYFHEDNFYSVKEYAFHLKDINYTLSTFDTNNRKTSIEHYKSFLQELSYNKTTFKYMEFSEDKVYRSVFDNGKYITTLINEKINFPNGLTHFEYTYAFGNANIVTTEFEYVFFD